MGTRPGRLTVVSCLALAALGCQPAAESGDSGDSDTPPAQTEQMGQEQMGVVQARCNALAEYRLTAPGSDTVYVELGLDEDGELTASEQNLVVARGQALKWRSDTLRWRVALVGGVSPYPPIKDGVAGGPDGRAAPEGARAVIGGDRGCYYYVAAAVHPETGDPLVLDPPIVVRDRE